VPRVGAWSSGRYPSDAFVFELFWGAFFVKDSSIEEMIARATRSSVMVVMASIATRSIGGENSGQIETDAADLP